MIELLTELAKLLRELVSRDKNASPAEPTASPQDIAQDVSAGEAYRRASHGPFVTTETKRD